MPDPDQVALESIDVKYFGLDGLSAYQLGRFREILATLKSNCDRPNVNGRDYAVRKALGNAILQLVQDVLIPSGVNSRDRLQTVLERVFEFAAGTTNSKSRNLARDVRVYLENCGRLKFIQTRRMSARGFIAVVRRKGSRVADGDAASDTIEVINVPSGLIVLRGAEKKPIVRGQEVDKLTPGQFASITALLQARPTGLSMLDLAEKSGYAQARRLLERLCKKSRLWKSVIYLAEKKGQGGYRIADE